MEAIVLAGGLGSRLRPVVADVPKPMAPVGGRPFLEYLFDYWTGQGVDRFILSVGYRHHAIDGHFAGRYKDAEIDYVVEERPRGTGGGVLLALEHLRRPDPFLIMNGDTFFEIDLASLCRYHSDKRAQVTISLREMEANSRYAGVEMDGDGRIMAFDSRARTVGRSLINGGVYLAERPAFAGMATDADGPCSIEEQLYPRMLAAQTRMYGFASPGRFIDIGVPEDYRRAAVILQARNATA